MTPTSVYRNGQWVPTDHVSPNGVHARPKPKPTLHVISDSLDGVEHPCDARRYFSKQKFRQATRYFGCDEVGNDPAGSRPGKTWEPSMDEMVSEVKKAIELVEGGNAPR